MSNYAKFFGLNVTKKGVQMRDYCLNFELQLQDRDRLDEFPAGQTHAQSLIGWESNLVVVPDISLVP